MSFPPGKIAITPQRPQLSRLYSTVKRGEEHGRKMSLRTEDERPKRKEVRTDGGEALAQIEFQCYANVYTGMTFISDQKVFAISNMTPMYFKG